MTNYKIRFKKTFVQVLIQYRTKYPTYSDDILQTMAFKTTKNIMADPMQRYV